MSTNENIETRETPNNDRHNSQTDDHSFKGRSKRVERGDGRQDRHSEERRVGGNRPRGGGAGARRRQHSEGSQSSDQPETPPVDRNLRLKVTFGETERKVKVQDEHSPRHANQRGASGFHTFFYPAITK